MRNRNVFITQILVFVMFGAAISDGTVDGQLLRLERTLRRISGQNIKVDTNVPTHSDAYDLLKDMSGGMSTDSNIDSEIKMITSGAKPVRWSTIKLKQPLRLTLVATHFHNQQKGLRILTLHSMPGSDLREDLVTYFNQKINEADMQNINNSIIIPQNINLDADKVKSTPTDFKQYIYKMSAEGMAGQFGLRDPEGAPIFAPVRENSFNPMSSLFDGSAAVNDQAESNFEVKAGDVTYAVTVATKITDLGQIVIETSVRDVNSSRVNTFYMVYESRDMQLTARAESPSPTVLTTPTVTSTTN